MYLREFNCEECGEVDVRKTASKKRCDRCQKAHRREAHSLSQSRWRRRMGLGGIEINQDPNMENAIYCG
jgi:hypothetical protein